jgi:flagellar basal-body rod protein FlgG
MINSLNHLWEIASSGMQSRQRQLDLLSHNIANVNTIGFKASQAGFQALIRNTVLTEEDAAVTENGLPGQSVREGMGALFTHSTHLFTQGTVTQTDDPHNLAINGDGFFQVTNPAGDILYTRAGDFHRDLAGNLVTTDGYRLQPAVAIPDAITEIYIDPSGRILGREVGNAQAQELGVIQLALFENPNGLENVGKHAFVATAASGPAQLGEATFGGRGALLSGYLEGSNVDLSQEMTELLRSQRAYSMSLRSLHVADELFRMANEMPRS